MPWDHDIDFSVWKKDVSKEDIISLFEKNGYTEKVITADMDCLHFVRPGSDKMVDISFYDINEDVASIKWAVVSEAFFARAIMGVLGIWLRPDQDLGATGKASFLISGLKKLIRLCGIFLPQPFVQFSVVQCHDCRIIQFRDLDPKDVPAYFAEFIADETIY